MRTTTVFQTAFAVSSAILSQTASAAFSARGNSNVVVYWGQGPNQRSLSDVCQNDNIDVIVVSFITEFPQTVGGYPSSNFGNACGGPYFKNSGLLASCPSIEQGINKCHSLGKKVFLSLGGETAYTQPPTTDVAEYFAEFLWGAFGPSSGSPPDSWVAAGSPRPFGSASVDGFDFDIEHGPGDRYADVINRLREPDLIGNNPFYISSAPQCIVPDANMATIIKNAAFDYIYVQFYNTPWCNSRTGVNDIKQGTNQFTFSTWVDWVKSSSKNPNAQVYIGLPPDSQAVGADKASVLSPDDAKLLLNKWQSTYPTMFGGVMLWDSSANDRAAATLPGGKDYAYFMKTILAGGAPPSNPQTSAPAQPTTQRTTATPIPVTSVQPSVTSKLSSVAVTTSKPATSQSPVTPPTSGQISPDGSCGPLHNSYICPSGTCCSKYGYCGVSDAHCGAGCLTAFGGCQGATTPTPSQPSITESTTTVKVTRTSSKAVSTVTMTISKSSNTSSAKPTTTPTTSKPAVSTTAKPSSSTTVKPSSSTTAKPSSSTTAKPSSSSSKKPSSTTSARPAASTKPISTNGGCGPLNGNTVCPNGTCCSRYGFCGTSAAYCGAGCVPGFGNCGVSGAMKRVVRKGLEAAIPAGL